MKRDPARRTFVGLVIKAGLLAALVLALIGCAGDDAAQDGTDAQAGDADAAAAAAAANLTVAWWGGEERHERYIAAMARLEEREEGLSLDGEWADLDPYLERLAAQAAAGNLPDVLWMRDTHVGRYAESGTLLNLEPYFGDLIDVEGIGEAAIEDGRVGDGVYALPTHYVGQTIMYNEELLEELGLEYPENGTWDDLAQLMRDIAERTEDGFVGANDPTISGTQRHLEAYIRQKGEELFDDDGQLGFSRETFAEWLQYWDDLRRDGAILPPGDQLERSGHENTPMLTGQAGLYIASTNHYPIVADLTDLRIGMSELPLLEGGAEDWRFFPPILLSIGADTPDPEAAARVFDAFINDLELAELTEVSHGAPSSSRVREHLIPMLPEPQARFLEQIGSEMEMERRPFPVRPEGSSELNGLIVRVSEQVAFGTLTIQQAVDELFRDAADILS